MHDVEDVEHQHRREGDGGPTRFGDDVGMFDALNVEGGADDVDNRPTVVDHFIVARMGVGGALDSQVIHRQAAAEVEIAQRGTLFNQCCVVAAGFENPGADVGKVGNLRAEVTVEQLQAVEHAVVVERFKDLEQLGRTEAETAAIAARFSPLTANFSVDLGSYADQGAYAEGLAAGKDGVELSRRFDDEEATVTEANGPQAEVDEFLIFIAVADQQGIGLQRGHGQHQFGLAAGL